MSSVTPEAGEEDPRQRAISRWDDDGGAIPTFPVESAEGIPEMSNTEMVHLRIRVIALENLLTAVLAEGSERQIAVAKAIAEYISPRPTSTQHPLTIQAGNHMSNIVERAVHYRSFESKAEYAALEAEV